MVRNARSALCASLVLALGAGALSPPSAGAASKGSVDVLYAGSLLDLMTMKLGPAFTKATGYTVSGVSAGSSALATEIKGGTQVADVFISASPSVNATLEGAANGGWVSTYDLFGTSPLRLGYNAHSRYARALRTRPWYDVVTRPGFLLGRTDPATDPKGVLAVDALEGVALSYDVPALAGLATDPSGVFAETALVGELQAGQLDAGFFYGVEAAAAHLETVPLVGTRLRAQYTVALVNRGPDVVAAKHFVAFLLSRAGRAILRANGIVPSARETWTAGPHPTTTTPPSTTTAP
jgi:molybdate transport system substrate-binding protein